MSSETDDDEDEAPKRLFVDCACHGPRQVCAFLCRHMVRWSWRKLGFIQNSDHPDDLQAWCDRCERVFLEEGGRTERFEKFHDMVPVCVGCYERIKQRHSR